MRTYKKVQEWREWDGWASDIFHLGPRPNRTRLVVLHGYAYNKYDPPIVKVANFKYFQDGHFCISVGAKPKVVYGKCVKLKQLPRILRWVKLNRKPIMEAWKTPFDEWDNAYLYKMKTKRKYNG